MSRKRFTPEPIIGKLREAEAAFAHRAPGRQQPAGLGGMEAEKALSHLPIENLPGWVRQGPAFFVPPSNIDSENSSSPGGSPPCPPRTERGGADLHGPINRQGGPWIIKFDYGTFILGA